MKYLQLAPSEIVNAEDGNGILVKINSIIELTYLFSVTVNFTYKTINSIQGYTKALEARQKDIEKERLTKESF